MLEKTCWVYRSNLNRWKGLRNPARLKCSRADSFGSMNHYLHNVIPRWSTWRAGVKRAQRWSPSMQARVWRQTKEPRDTTAFNIVLGGERRFVDSSSELIGLLVDARSRPFEIRSYLHEQGIQPAWLMDALTAMKLWNGLPILSIIY